MAEIKTKKVKTGGRDNPPSNANQTARSAANKARKIVEKLDIIYLGRFASSKPKIKRGTGRYRTS